MKKTEAPLAIEARGLVKVYGDNRAVDGIDISVPTGMIYGVLGPNGAGKTTTINMLATLLKPDAGSAKVFGHDVQTESQIVRQLIGVTGQFASVDELLSANENLIIFSRLLGFSKSESRQKAKDLLEEFGLTDAAKRPISKFSGGMRRRLDLALSLIAQPPLIFLDEPTTGLDPRTRTQMWNTIHKLVDSGSTILLTTQYLEEADQLADRIAVIDKGRVVAEGTPPELKASVGKSRLELTLEDAADATKALTIVQDVLNVKAQSIDSTSITAPMTNPEGVTDVLIALRKSSVHLSGVSVNEPTLDEVFFALTGNKVAQEETTKERRGVTK